MLYQLLVQVIWNLNFSTSLSDDEKLKMVVGTVGPIAVGIDARLDTFVNYQSGIYYNIRCSTNDITYAIIIVGYGTEDETDFWLIRNSWVSFTFYFVFLT